MRRRLIGAVLNKKQRVRGFSTSRGVNAFVKNQQRLCYSSIGRKSTNYRIVCSSSRKLTKKSSPFQRVEGSRRRFLLARSLPWKRYWKADYEARRFDLPIQVHLTRHIINPLLFTLAVSGTSIFLAHSSSLESYRQNIKNKLSSATASIPLIGNLSPCHRAFVFLTTLNLAVFTFLSIATRNRRLFHFALRHLRNSIDSKPHTLLTSTFAHVNPGRLITNSVVLYSIMSGVYDNQDYGAEHFWALFLTSAVTGNFAHRLWFTFGKSRSLVTATGMNPAVYGVLGALAALYPNVQLRVPVKKVEDYSLSLGVVVGALCLIEFGILAFLSNLTFSHASHLAGVAVGYGYVQARTSYLQSKNIEVKPEGKKSLREQFS